MFVRIDDFGTLPDHVRESALSKIEHADPQIVGWTEQADGVAIQLSEGASVDGLEERVRRLMQETISSFRFFRSETLDEDAGAPINDVSPFDALVASGQVAMTGPGVPVYQGDLARRLGALDDRIREIAWSRGAMEQLYPTTVPTGSLTTNGYLSSYPQHALLAASIHRDVDSLAKASEMAKAQGGDYAGQICEMLEDADEVLAPTVCYRCFESLKVLPHLARPLAAGRTFTGLALCHRREDKALVELSRLQTFRMREIVFFGGSEFVSEHRDWWIEAFAKMLRDWKARFRFVAASDPFFLASSAQKRAYQSMRKLKYECQLHIPHSDTWVAVASFNNHEASLTDAYGLREDGGEGPSPTHSGCVGFGYDRLVYALLCQFGLDSARWPETLRVFFGEAERPAAAWAV